MTTPGPGVTIKALREMLVFVAVLTHPFHRGACPLMHQVLRFRRTALPTEPSVHTQGERQLRAHHTDQS